MEIGTIQPVDIDRTMRSAYLDYAMSVIVSRALPDARDGLKPVHRRILFGMHEMGVRSNSSYKKSARIVGDVLGKYHPHGDSAVYEAMARMAQDFSMRYVLVDGQGNFGSIDGDAPAAMRYTEARMDIKAEEMLADIDKETVDFTDNFDNSLQEPVVLPARLPNLLLNGSSGIAVGMATNIPPHNLRELGAAIIYLIEHYDNVDDVTVEELMEYLPGPDFPTGGIIIGNEGIRQAYSTGRGRLVVRGKAHFEKIKKDRGERDAVIITEIPYQINKTSLIERIADLAREEKLDTVADLRDESDRRGIRIVVELKNNSQPLHALNQLYKFTPLQTTFGVQVLALVEGEPRHLPLKRSLSIFIDHRHQVITRRSQFELDKARKRAHILDGLMIALANLDDVIRTIRESPDVDQARERLIKRFRLSEIQAQAILDMQLRRLAALERQKIEDEQRTTKERIVYLEDLLANPQKILDIIKEDMVEVIEKYGDARRTEIDLEAREVMSEKDLIVDEQVLISITMRGYIKRVASKTYRTQARGRVGVKGQATGEEDEVVMLLSAGTHDTILFFSDRGKVYSEKAHQIPVADRTGKGAAIANILSLDSGEHITAAVRVPGFDSAAYCTMATVKGRVKRMALSEFASVRPSGIIAISLDKGDQLGWARLTSGKDEIILVTAQGQALRFSESQVRTMGRTAGGVTGINLQGDDRVAAMEVVEEGGCLLVVTEKGYGKRSKLDLYPLKRRGAKGMATISQKSLATIGAVASARVVQDDDEITFITSAGMVLRLKVENISLSGRTTRGVRLMNLTKSGDTLASLARIPHQAEMSEE